MKNLSLEEKAKRYDKAIEKAEKWHNAPNVDKIPTFGNRIIEDIFPELYESEDERIRRLIIKHFKEIADRNEQSWKNLDIPYIIAWLEKQGEQNSTWSEYDELMLKDMIEFIKTGWSNRGKSHLIYWLKSIKNKIK